VCPTKICGIKAANLSSAYYDETASCQATARRRLLDVDVTGRSRRKTLACEYTPRAAVVVVVAMHHALALLHAGRKHCAAGQTHHCAFVREGVHAWPPAMAGRRSVNQSRAASRRRPCTSSSTQLVLLWALVCAMHSCVPTPLRGQWYGRARPATGRRACSERVVAVALAPPRRPCTALRCAAQHSAITTGTNNIRAVGTYEPCGILCLHLLFTRAAHVLQYCIKYTRFGWCCDRRDGLASSCVHGGPVTS
jgi:hypothetical protein